MKGNHEAKQTTMFCFGCLRYLSLKFFPPFCDSRTAVCWACGRIPKRHTFRRDHKKRILEIYNEHKLAQVAPLDYTLRDLRHFCLVKHLKVFAQFYEVSRLSEGKPELRPTVVKKDPNIPFTLENLHVTTVGPSKLLWSDTH